MTFNLEIRDSGSVLFRRASLADYAGILGLQAKNYIGNLAAEEAREGFLSIEYTEAQFDEINRDLGIAVAVRDRAVLGYLCATSFAYGRKFPILAELIRRLEGGPARPDRAFIYGPVCVDASVRGRGVLQGLFGTMKEIARPRYRYCILFISGGNPRSLNAHRNKLGMSDLGTFVFSGREFHMLGAETG